MYYPRALENIVLNKLNTSNKGVVIYGSRQVGKTSLVNQIISILRLHTLTINGDQNQYLDIITSRDLNKIQNLVHPFKLLFIDEAQRIPEIGINLKIILDNLKDLKVIVTGSSALDLASKIDEPLTGRIWSYQLYPLSYLELSKIASPTQYDQTLEERLIFGAYPEIYSYSSYQDKQEYLRELSSNYLYKDLLEFSGIKNSSKIRDILKLLAFQVGSQVSLNELSNQLDLNKETVGHYLDLLEKSFVIFRLYGFSRNLRKEVVKKPKIYFYDLGVRNVFADNFNLLNSRNDLGSLWENYLIIERIKSLAYSRSFASSYFWRTYTGAEIDYLEEKDGALHGYEFKWSKNRSRSHLSWQTNYPGATFDLINHDNYHSFLTLPSNQPR